MSSSLDPSQWRQLSNGTWVPLRLDDSPAAQKAIEDVLGRPGTSLLQPWRGPGGPRTILASYELVRHQLNALTRIVDALLIGQHSRAYEGNIRLVNRGRAKSLLAQHLVDPIVDERRPINPAMHFVQSIRGRRRAVDLNRASYVLERRFVGDVRDGGRPFIQLAERLDEGAVATGAWLEDARRLFSIQHDGTFFSQGGLFLFGSSAHAILRGPSMFLEGGGNLVLMGQGVTADDASGYACALAAGAPGQLFIGDLYSSIDISAFLFGDLNLIHAIDGLPSKITSGYQVLRELSDAQITALGTPASGTGFVYVRQADEHLYFKNDDGTTFDLTGAGVTDHGALTGLGDDDHTIYALVDGTRAFTGPVTARRTGAGTSTPAPVLLLEGASSGTTAAGFGAEVEVGLQHDGGNVSPALSLGAVWTDATQAGYDADAVLKLARGGATPTEVARVTSEGKLGLTNTGGYRATLDPAALTAARTHALPDASGTLALTSALYTSPTTTQGDLIRRGASADERLAHPGSNGKVLQSGATDPEWIGVESVLDHIGNTRGDIVYRGATVWEDLPIGTEGQVLACVDDGSGNMIPGWVDPTDVLSFGSIAVSTAGGISRTVPAKDTGAALRVWFAIDTTGNITLTLDGVNLIPGFSNSFNGPGIFEAVIVVESSTQALCTWKATDDVGGNQAGVDTITGLDWTDAQDLNATVSAGDLRVLGVEDAFGSATAGGGGGGGGSGTTGCRLNCSYSVATSDFSSAAMVSFSSEDYDDAAYWDSGDPKKIYVPEAGDYLITFHSEWAIHATGIRDVWFEHYDSGGTQVGPAYHANQLATSGGGIFGPSLLSSIVLRASAGDYFMVGGLQNSGGALTLNGQLDVHKLGTP